MFVDCYYWYWFLIGLFLYNMLLFMHWLWMSVGLLICLYFDFWLYDVILWFIVLINYIVVMIWFNFYFNVCLIDDCWLILYYWLVFFKLWFFVFNCIWYLLIVYVFICIYWDCNDVNAVYIYDNYFCLLFVLIIECVVCMKIWCLVDIKLCDLNLCELFFI